MSNLFGKVALVTGSSPAREEAPASALPNASPKTAPPLGRVGQPSDITAAVSYAVSDDAAWITGTTIDVAGGMVF